jgi:hypothetical protein
MPLGALTKWLDSPDANLDRLLFIVPSSIARWYCTWVQRSFVCCGVGQVIQPGKWFCQASESAKQVILPNKWFSQASDSARQVSLPNKWFCQASECAIEVPKLRALRSSSQTDSVLQVRHEMIMLGSPIWPTVPHHRTSMLSNHRVYVHAGDSNTVSG